jgi:hypothetical protein
VPRFETARRSAIAARYACPSGLRPALRHTVQPEPRAHGMAGLKRHGVELLPETDEHGAGVRWTLPRGQLPQTRSRPVNREMSHLWMMVRPSIVDYMRARF